MLSQPYKLVNQCHLLSDFVSSVATDSYTVVSSINLDQFDFAVTSELFRTPNSVDNNLNFSSKQAYSRVMSIVEQINDKNHDPNIYIRRKYLEIANNLFNDSLGSQFLIQELNNLMAINPVVIKKVGLECIANTLALSCLFETPTQALRFFINGYKKEEILPITLESLILQIDTVDKRANGYLHPKHLEIRFSLMEEPISTRGSLDAGGGRRILKKAEGHG
jgi:hypothetical protein